MSHKPATIPQQWTALTRCQLLSVYARKCTNKQNQVHRACRSPGYLGVRGERMDAVYDLCGSRRTEARMLNTLCGLGIPKWKCDELVDVLLKYEIRPMA